MTTIESAQLEARIETFREAVTHAQAAEAVAMMILTRAFRAVGIDGVRVERAAWEAAVERLRDCNKKLSDARNAPFATAPTFKTI